MQYVLYYILTYLFTTCGWMICGYGTYETNINGRNRNRRFSILAITLRRIINLDGFSIEIQYQLLIKLLSRKWESEAAQL